MSAFFRKLRKGRNISRLVAVFFLLLMTVEIYGHAQKEFNNLIPEKPPQFLSFSDSDSSEAAEITNNEFEVSEFAKSIIWSDQASHHQVLITVFYFDSAASGVRCERIPFHFAESLYKSSAPPNLPPETV